MTNTKAQVLLASSQSSVAHLIARMCASIGYPSVEIAGNLDQALEAFDQVAFDVVLIDENVGSADIDDLLAKLRGSKVSSKTRFVLLTTSMTKAAVHKAVKAGIDAILLKPFSASDLKSRLQALTEARSASRPSRSLTGANSPYAVVL